MGKKLLTSFVACLSLIVFVGCGGGGLPTIPVTGTVMVDGKPMEGVNVIFSPAAGSSGQAASGQTDAEGKYTLTTEVAGDGALAGDYVVAISKNVNEDDGLPKEVDPSDSAAMDALYSQLDTRKQQKSTSMVAAKWGKSTTSGLTATVAEGAENNFPFEVTSK